MAKDTYELTTRLWLPLPRPQVFDFFADARNLQRITPAFLGFEVLNRDPIDMRAGALIDYRLRLHRLPLRWRTKITQWNPPHEFVDTQLRGPYRQWIHTHTFEEQDGGTLIHDRVRYQLPGPAPAARLVNRFMVAPDTTAIFTYRHDALCAIFDAQTTARKGPIRIVRL